MLIWMLGSSLAAAEKAPSPLIKAELDSIECNFAPQEQQPPCTIRIHLLPQKGISITPTTAGDSPHEPLQCMDGTGRLLLGTFREWEHCYDGNDACYTAVYDFFTVPQGSTITVDTHISVPITRPEAEPVLSPLPKKPPLFLRSSPAIPGTNQNHRHSPKQMGTIDASRLHSGCRQTLPANSHHHHTHRHDRTCTAALSRQHRSAG